MQSIKAGTRVELKGTPACGGFPGVPPESGTVKRWTARNGPITNHAGPDNPGWHVIALDAGGTLIVHETGFRVLSNR